DAATSHVGSVFLYFISLYLASLIFGFLLRWFTVTYDLDRKISVLRLGPWFYLLADNRRKSVPPGWPPAQVFLAAVVNTGQHTFICRGVLEETSLDSTGNLDVIALRNASRRKIEDDKGEGHAPGIQLDDPRYYPLF